MLLMGKLKLVWLNRLKNSIRNWNRLFSFTGKLFITAKSNRTSRAVKQVSQNFPVSVGSGPWG